ncbi:MAG: hypothetical protein IKT24_03515, partial [Clostridia bacterium]|nr:hypothetical protein [Clostridia bacterium]
MTVDKTPANAADKNAAKTAAKAAADTTPKGAANTADFGTCAKCPFRNPERICDTPDGKAPPFCST